MRILDVDQVPPSEAPALTPHLLPAEPVLAAFRATTAAVVLTELRILLAVREALLVEKVETGSWPWRAVQHFALLEAAGDESRAALKIWLGTEPQPLHLRANAGTDLRPIQQLLAERLA